MNVLRKVTSSLDNALNLVMGKGLKSATDQIIKKYPSLYTHYILTSRG